MKQNVYLLLNLSIYYTIYDYLNDNSNDYYVPAQVEQNVFFCFRVPLCASSVLSSVAQEATKYGGCRYSCDEGNLYDYC